MIRNDLTFAGSQEGNGFGGHVVRVSRTPALEPKNWFIDQKGNGLVFRVVNRGKNGTDVAASGASRYDIHWAETVDVSTAAGIDAGFRRSKVVAVIPALDIEDMESESPVLDNEDYQSGYFYCVGVAPDGDRSTFGQPKRITSGIQSTAVPENVTHFQVSESGEQQNGTVWSALSVSCVMQRGAAGVQLVLQHYPNINEVTFWVSKRYAGLAGGSMQFKELAQVCRRKGVGTITVTVASTAVTGVSSTFTIQAKAGDYLEIAGVRAQIASVTNATTLTLTAVWPATTRSYAAHADYEFIGLVRVYGRALSDGDAGDVNLANLPYVDVLMDGELSTANAPTITGLNRGDAIVLTWQQVMGTRIKGYRVYRGAGVSIVFNQCLAIGWVEQPKDSASASGSLLEYIDKSFTIYEREQSAPFTYYVVTVNERDEPSAASVGSNVSARLNAPDDGGPGVTARELAFNQLWNGHINGTAAGSVGTGDATQDTNMGGAAPAGRYRWTGVVVGVGSAPGHVNTNEVVLGMTGAGAGTSSLEQTVDGWDNTTAGRRRIPGNKILVLQFKARSSSGTAPDGVLYADIYQSNAGVIQAMKYRVRLVDDSVDTAGSFLSVAGTNVVSDPQIFWAVFVPDSAYTTTHFIVRIYYVATNWNGNNIYISEVMLSFGETLPPYTPQMADPSITYSRLTGGAPIPPTGFSPSDGSRRPYIDIQMP